MEPMPKASAVVAAGWISCSNEMVQVITSPCGATCNGYPRAGVSCVTIQQWDEKSIAGEL